MHDKKDIGNRTYDFSLENIKLVSKMSSSLVNKILSNQLLRSSTSIGANIIEARSSSSRREFIKYYTISLRSANETIYWLSLIKDAKLVELQLLDNLLDECKQLAKILAASLIKLKERNKL